MRPKLGQIIYLFYTKIALFTQNVIFLQNIKLFMFFLVDKLV